jgi:hypothetical protein
MEGRGKGRAPGKWLGILGLEDGCWGLWMRAL